MRKVTWKFGCSKTKSCQIKSSPGTINITEAYHLFSAFSDQSNLSSRKLQNQWPIFNASVYSIVCVGWLRRSKRHRCVKCLFSVVKLMASEISVHRLILKSYELVAKISQELIIWFFYLTQWTHLRHKRKAYDPAFS